LYWWEGKIEKSTESIMIVKTRESLVEEASSVIKAHHSYTVPCIAKIDVEIPFKPFEEWLFKETES
ncbi:MAG: divalent cation tolerance protein CutA, partial [Caldimicrobium sp.]